jgi:hypothetical protein
VALPAETGDAEVTEAHLAHQRLRFCLDGG